MQNTIKEGKNYLQVESCCQGQSSTSGNEYWVLTCNVLPKPGTARRNNLCLLDSFKVYYMKKFEWALEKLQDIIVVCECSKPWDLCGKKFIGDVKKKGNFFSIDNPRPYTEEEEEEKQEETDGINAQSEWPW